MKPKSGTITHYIEIPVKVHYTWNPSEPQTLTYPGCPASIDIDEIEIPDSNAIQDMVPDDDRLAEICWDDPELL